mmetsp:Transcript_7652/g.18739  ORF Transcript_7652/g.18739 Transcript_7652/m.18739 type:complete len:246 (+) Transcript_7652:1588-2325(+)
MVAHGAADVARAPRARPSGVECGMACLEDLLVLAHAEVVVGAPDLDLIPLAVLEEGRVGEPAAVALQGREDAVAALLVQLLDRLLDGLVVEELIATAAVAARCLCWGSAIGRHGVSGCVGGRCAVERGAVGMCVVIGAPAAALWLSTVGLLGCLVNHYRLVNFRGHGAHLGEDVPIPFDFVAHAAHKGAKTLDFARGEAQKSARHPDEARTVKNSSTRAPLPSGSQTRRQSVHRRPAVEGKDSVA